MELVLVDTSVWIHFLSNKVPYATDLSKLLNQNGVLGHPLIFGELLMGDSGGRAPFLQTYHNFLQARQVSHKEVVDFVLRRRLHGRGVGWIDVNLLASAMVEGVGFWTADPRLAILAEELGLKSPA
jgi:predicted nucleic acid-binding protein